jgi:hypothetical protein
VNLRIGLTGLGYSDKLSYFANIDNFLTNCVIFNFTEKALHPVIS